MNLCTKCQMVSDGSFCKWCGSSTRPVPPIPNKPEIQTVIQPKIVHVPTVIQIQAPPPARLQCQVCGQGRLIRRKVYRLSGPVVVIGYIFLIPSFIGIYLSASALDSASNNNHSDVIVPGLAIIFGIASFVSGIFGWLLVMKKKILQCSACGAVVSAS